MWVRVEASKWKGYQVVREPAHHFKNVYIPVPEIAAISLEEKEKKARMTISTPNLQQSVFQ